MSFKNCVICGSEMWSLRDTVCESCTMRTGVVTMPPARRRVSPCAKCSGTKLVRAVPRELDDSQPRRLFATYFEDDDNRTGNGVFEAYICRACGFVEWYCQNPEEIPIGPEFMTEEIDLGSHGPYR